MSITNTMNKYEHMSYIQMLHKQTQVDNVSKSTTRTKIGNNQQIKQKQVLSVQGTQ